MAAGPWQIYNEAKKYLMDGTLDINTNAWRIALYTSASNAATLTLSAKSELTNEVTSGAGYSSSGKALASVVWSSPPGSAAKMRFTAAAVYWSANAAPINSVKYAVIFDPVSGKLLCVSALSTAQFNITAGNRLTVTPAAQGIFELM